MNDDLKSRLLKAFEGEGRERIQVLTSDILALSKGPADVERRVLVESAFRETHSLKGAARAVGLDDVEQFCQALESVFASLKKKDQAPSAKARESLVGWVDMLSDLLLGVGEGGSSADGRISLTLSRIRDFAASDLLYLDEGGKSLADPCEGAECVCSDNLTLTDETGQQPDSSARKGEDVPRDEQGDAMPGANSKSAKAVLPTLGETVRVDASFLTNLLLQTEELLFSRNALDSRAEVLFDLSERFEEMSRSLRELSFKREVGKQLITEEGFERFKKDMSALSEELQKVSHSSRKARWELSSRVDSLISDFKTSMLLPFSSLLDIFPKMVRDICRESDKMVDLSITGGDVRIDRRILERLKDPLVHIIRNSIDHGIESPQERQDKGKPESGRVSISITRRDRDVIRILIRDDGAGLNTEKLKATAVKKGYIPESVASSLDRRGAMDLIFLSGMSTSRMITDISGRGLGMAIVRDRLETLGGSIFVSSVSGKGLRTVIHLPVALTSFRGIIVESSGQSFVVPKTAVRRVVLVRTDDVAVSGGRETVVHSGKVIPLVGLADILELEAKNFDRESFPAMIFGKGRSTVAVSVDELQGEQDIMAKPLGPKLVRVRNVSGVSMLGSGSLSPILHVPDMIKTAFSLHSGVGGMSVSHVRKDSEARTVLVAEDSITSRVLLKNVLEAAGYNVITAVDGEDALAKVRSEGPDVLVSDVEMPRLDGFGLTERVRRIDRFASLPVILVTSLGSREDRERGVDAGANAYIVKSSFDQSNLLDVVARFC